MVDSDAGHSPDGNGAVSRPATLGSRALAGPEDEAAGFVSEFEAQGEKEIPGGYC